VNGRADPDAIVLRTGQPARLRFINLSTVNPAPLIWLTARPDSATQLASDSVRVHWRLTAKDGLISRIQRRCIATTVPLIVLTS